MGATCYQNDIEIDESNGTDFSVANLPITKQRLRKLATFVELDDRN